MTPQAFFAAWRAGERAVLAGATPDRFHTLAATAADAYARRRHRSRVDWQDYADVWADAAFGLAETLAKRNADLGLLRAVRTHYWRKAA